MTDDEAILHTPTGYRWLILMATVLKRWLATSPMTASDQLEILEGLHHMTGDNFNAAALTVLAPADDATMRVVREAWKLNGDGRLSPSFDVLTSADVFSNLARANPSLLQAIRIMWPDAPPNAAPETSPPQPPATMPAPYIGPHHDRTAEPQLAQNVDFPLF